MGEKARAFTLVELVIVIAIIGILAAVAIPRFADLRDEARGAARDGVISAVRSGILVVSAQNQATDSDPEEFPPDLETDWGGVTAGGTIGSAGTLCSANPCFELLMTNPVSDANWRYTSTAGTTYTYDFLGSGATQTCVYDNSDGSFTCT